MKALKWGVLLALVPVALCCVSSENEFRVGLAANLDRNVVIKTASGAMCAGVVIRTNLVATARHCKADAMTVDGRPAAILAESEDSDVMLLRAITKEVVPVEFNERPQVGEAVYSVVNVSGFKSILSRSHIMGFTKSTILAENIGAPGISGGGYYDEKGRLVGIGSQFQSSIVPDPTIGNQLFAVGGFSIAVAIEKVRELMPTEVPIAERPVE